MFGGRQRHRFDRPTHVGGADGLALRAFPSPAHSIGQPFGQRQTVLRRTVVVLARANVAACAGEMNVQGGGDGQLAEETGQPRKVRIGQPSAVVALGVRGVVAQDGHGPLTVPQADQGKGGVNRALRLGADRRVFGRRPASGPDFAVRPQDAPVGGDLIHPSLAQAKVRQRLRPWQGFPHGRLQIGDHLALETTLELAWIDARFVEDAFRREVTVRRIVLMQRMHGHPARRRDGGAGEGIAKGIVTFIGNADPVHGTKYRSAPPRPTGRCLAPAAQAPSGWSPDHRPSSSQREGSHPRRKWPRARPTWAKRQALRIAQRGGQRRLRTGGQMQEQAGQACRQINRADEKKPLLPQANDASQTVTIR